MDILHADQEKPHTSFTRVIQELYNIPGYIIMTVAVCVFDLPSDALFFVYNWSRKQTPKKTGPKVKCLFLFTHRDTIEIHCWGLLSWSFLFARVYICLVDTLATTSDKKSTCLWISFIFSLCHHRGEAFSTFALD